MDNLESKEAQISVSKTYLGKTKIKQDKILIRPFVTSTSTVGVKLGRTINMGNYENIKLEVFISAPCYKEEIVDVYNQIKVLTEELITKEIERLVS